MANGDDQNWMRVCMAVDGFRGRYGRWPKRVRIMPICYVNLVSHVLSPIGFALVSSFIELVPEDDAEMIAEDDTGATHCYGSHGPGDVVVSPSTYNFFGDAVLSTTD